jgi:RNA polymerase sigma-70 factor (ECF subfamily)
LVPIDPAAFRTAWPQVVRSLAVTTRSLDRGEECAAEAFARAAAQPDGAIDDLVAWCIQVGRRTWLDTVRHQAVFTRLQPQVARPEVAAVDVPTEPDAPGGDLDDRLALLFVACDDALAPGAQLVLAMRVVCGLTIRQIAGHLGIAEATAAARLTRAKSALARARGEFAVPDGAARAARLPVVLACVAGLFTVGQRDELEPVDATEDPARDALTLAEALVAEYPDEGEVLGLRAVCRLGLARRPGRVRDGVALPLDEVDRSAWDQRLLSAGLDDATAAITGTRAPGGPGRFALEAAISGVHAAARTAADTDWARLAQLYDALLEIWPSPATRVARLVVLGRLAMRDGGGLRDGGAGAGAGDGVGAIERELEELVAEGPPYAARDASLALADLARHTGRTDEAAARYRELLDVIPAGPLREFCRRHAG